MIRNIFILAILLIPSICLSAITFTNDKWESTLDCSSMGGCNGLDYTSAASDLCTAPTYESNISVTHNNPLGTGKALQMWIGDDQNDGTVGYDVYFPADLDEVWVRIYLKYELGYHWNFLGYDKILYFDNGYVFEWLNSNSVNLANGETALIDNGVGWDATMACGTTGAGTDPACDGDGEWHSIEVYMKAGTGTGVYRAWVDGVLVANHTGQTFSPMGEVALFGNQNLPGNGECTAVYEDDFAIYKANPPNVDASGNPMIGPIGWSGSPPTCSDGIQNGDETGVDCGGSCSACGGGATAGLSGSTTGTLK